MDKIIDRLYVGDKDDVTTAEKRGYSILAACKDGSDDCHRGAPKDKDYHFYRTDKKHLALNLIDVPDPDMIPKEVIDEGLTFMKERYDAGDTVLSHCVVGHSRGPTMMLMFLRAIGEMPSGFRTSELKFRTLYPNYDPAMGMRQTARNRWDELPTFFGGENGKP